MQESQAMTSARTWQPKLDFFEINVEKISNFR